MIIIRVCAKSLGKTCFSAARPNKIKANSPPCESSSPACMAAATWNLKNLHSMKIISDLVLLRERN